MLPVKNWKIISRYRDRFLYPFSLHNRTLSNILVIKYRLNVKSVLAILILGNKYQIFFFLRAVIRKIV